MKYSTLNANIVNFDLPLLTSSAYCLHRLMVDESPPGTLSYDYVTCRDYMFHVVKWLEGHINTKGPTIVVGDFKCPDINWLNWSVPS